MSIGQRSKVNYEQLHYKKLYSAMAQAEAELEAGMIRGEKRKDYWSWEQFYMSVAFLSSKRSRDPNTEDRVGACIVNPESKKIVGIGHNGLPESRGWDQEDFPHWDTVPPEDIDDSEYRFENTKYAHVCHAATNAILNKNAENLKDCVLYTTLFPGHEEAKMIIQAGISKVVYFDDQYSHHDYIYIARKLFKKAGVSFDRYSQDTTPSQSLAEVNVYPLPSSSLGGKAVCPAPRSPSTIPDSKPLSDKDFFMIIACLAARRSKDPSRQISLVGACIVNADKKIVGIGYNGFPLRVSDDDPDMTWGKGKEDDDPSQKKHPYVVHAEVNAIMHKTCIDLKDCTLYTTLFPCNECAKVIVQCGIERIYYLMDDHHNRIYMIASQQLLNRARYDIDAEKNMQQRGEQISESSLPGQEQERDKKIEKICHQYTPSRSCVLPDLKILPRSRAKLFFVFVSVVVLLIAMLVLLYRD